MSAPGTIDFADPNHIRRGFLVPNSSSRAVVPLYTNQISTSRIGLRNDGTNSMLNSTLRDLWTAIMGFVIMGLIGYNE